MKPPIVLLLMAGLSTPAWAQSPPPQAQLPIVTQAAPSDIVVTADVPVRAERKSPMLKDAELETLRGGQSLVITNQTMDSIVSGNVLKGDYTAGAVTLSDFALSNFNGVGNLLINTGAQVSAQSGMNLTINLGD
ncbi:MULTISPECIES: hypothetical protein [unclassified Sphingopyxis]|jgi:hypothetical protein|uniref:hypothetical protein n=1 Tax=unclassified Sphingopyxis TaxID=2614943 RepID=UPI0006C600BA|nr:MULTISPECIES: hypothetical protein [unclassified Sphingopyxis]USI75904.1 hypothetical protein KEC45_14130 [Sphingopyxis sp. USTB-05]GAO77557.1 hypothetical protein SC1_00848 [Sphingopyxis sp. C-1]